MTALVIGVSGGIASGKSAFIAGLAGALGATTTGFGDYVREEATRLGLDPSAREVLQGLGEQLKADLGDDAFVARVLARAAGDRHTIVDGVRHVEIADAIGRVVAPRRFVLVFLDADAETRRARAEVSRPTDAGRLDSLASHSTERQVQDGSIRGRADLILDATQAIDAMVAQTLERLGPLVDPPG